MKLCLYITSFNGLSQAIYTYLKDDNYIVNIVYSNSSTKDSEIDNFNPDIILCPFLKDFISQSIYDKYPTFVFHPGVIGSRGAYSIEWALWKEKQKWGGVWLKANEIYDGGDVYASGEFILRDTTKASIYRIEEKNLALELLPTLLENIKNKDSQKQVLNPIDERFNTTIDWEKDDTNTIVKKINTLDSFPGVKDEILDIECFLYGAHKEDKFKHNQSKKILAKRDGAICISTIDGAVWVSHLKQVDKFKLPATYVLKDRLKGIKEDRLPLIFDKSYNTFYEISCDIKDNIAYLYFNFHNGAFRSEQCMRLKYAIEYLKEQVKVIVLMGGDDFFSNGINLNILEDSKKSGEDGWSNINAINDLVKSIIYATEVITVASIEKNAGAGGVFLATACDFVISSNSVVLNPHYKTLGLSGSEYHTYSLYKRVKKDIADKLLNDCLPISSKYAKDIGLVDEVYDIKDYKNSLKNYCKDLIYDENKYDEFIWDKEDYLEKDEQKILKSKEDEIKIMYNEFWDKSSIFHKLRYEFVYKVCPTSTPKRLKYKG